MDSVAPGVEVSVYAFCICLFHHKLVFHILCLIGMKVVSITTRGICTAHSGKTLMTSA